jgi:hypothetical protein
MGAAETEDATRDSRSTATKLRLFMRLLLEVGIAKARHLGKV